VTGSHGRRAHRASSTSIGTNEDVEVEGTLTVEVAEI
jgi:hypothetical protein